MYKRSASIKAQSPEKKQCGHVKYCRSCFQTMGECQAGLSHYYLYIELSCGSLDLLGGPESYRVVDTQQHPEHRTFSESWYRSSISHYSFPSRTPPTILTTKLPIGLVRWNTRTWRPGQCLAPLPLLMLNHLPLPLSTFRLLSHGHCRVACSRWTSTQVQCTRKAVLRAAANHCS